MNDAPPRFAVFGHPIKHSLSPEIHAAFGRQTGRELIYTAIDAPPARFVGIVREFFAGGGRGANVTLPDKRLAFELAEVRTAVAERAGVANVLTRLADGRLEADNTDGAGLVRDLAERHRVDLRGHDALLLGAGGAAHGVAGALLDAGVRSLTIVNRTAATADALADRLGDPARVHTRYWEDLGSIGSFDLIVNGTSAGVLGEALELPFSIAANRALCYDLAYGGAAAGFLAWARAAAARYAFDGLGMLVETAADAFVRWHGVRPDTEPVYQVLRAREG